MSDTTPQQRLLQRWLQGEDEELLVSTAADKSAQLIAGVSPAMTRRP